MTRSDQQNYQNDRTDRPELFFTLSDQVKYTPRAVLIDLEPLVVTKTTSVLPMINPRNVHLSDKGLGAGNNWSNGYVYGNEHQEELFNIIDREADKCDNLGNFQLFHSVAGGTGAGVGSLVLELLSDRYGQKKMINTFSVFPSNEDTSDVVVQPYNTMLTLKRLIDYSMATCVFHNDALNSIENILFNNKSLSNLQRFEATNILISSVCALVLNPLRFPNYAYALYELIFSTLIPSPELKFLLCLLAPFTNELLKHPYINEFDMVLELFKDDYKMNRVERPQELRYILIMNYLIGDNLNQQDIRKAVAKINQRVNFVDWVPLAIQMVNGRKSPFVSQPNEQRQLSGIQLSNNNLMISMFEKISEQFDRLYKRKAYINNYLPVTISDEAYEVELMFQDSKESVLRVIDEYKACCKADYLLDDVLDEDYMAS